MRTIRLTKMVSRWRREEAGGQERPPLPAHRRNLQVVARGRRDFELVIYDGFESVACDVDNAVGLERRALYLTKM